MAETEVPSASMITLLRRTTRLMLSELVERLARAGHPNMSPAFHPLFENIDAQGTRLTELAARCDMTHQSMSELVVLLEERGYLERRPDPSDGRARLLCLTQRGKELVRLAIAEMTAIEAQWLERWGSAGEPGSARTALETALRQAERARTGLSRSAP
jgi:DNA-binding MarR family transcriptional regulator